MKKLVALMLCALLALPSLALAEEEKVLNILSWEGYVDSDTLAAFEEETGIDVPFLRKLSRQAVKQRQP